MSAIHDVNRLAFDQPGEANLVDALRQQDALVDSLVAIDANTKTVCGYLAISPVTIVDKDYTHKALGMGPVAVRPECQRQGIGSQLIQYWLHHCANARDNLLVVLGRPSYYPRFGFKPAAHFGISCEYDVSPEAFMVLELRPGALNTICGRVQYHPAFASL